METPACLYKIAFNPVSAATVTCLPGLTAAFDLAVSTNEDLALVSGQFREGGGTRCGVFEIRLPGGEPRQVLAAPDCGSYRFENSWISLSLSPDASRAIAVRQDRRVGDIKETLELVHLAAGTSSPVADGIVKAAWSPDGRWIAALNVHQKTELIDTSDFKIKRVLADSEVQWSPDSQYLLRIKTCFFPIASNGVGTVEALDVATGKSMTIGSSKCAVVSNSTGWVRGGVVQ
jgi:dipeptidyl aminopeptidase/acylaminoacyl peptidase